MFWVLLFGVGFALGSYTTEKWKQGDVWQEIEGKVRSCNRGLTRQMEGIIEDQLIPKYIREQYSVSEYGEEGDEGDEDEDEDEERDEEEDGDSDYEEEEPLTGPITERELEVLNKSKDD